MDASCGPGSAISQLEKHSRRDNSLQHEAVQRGQARGQQPAFHSQPGIDANLNREFQQFSQGKNMDFNVISERVPVIARQHYGQPGPSQAQFRSPRAANQQWVQDFKGLSLQQDTQMRKHQAPQPDNWSLQFMQQNKQQNLSSQRSHQSMMHLGQHLQAMLQQTDEVEKMNSKAFDDRFDQISSEMELMEETEHQQDQQQARQNTQRVMEDNSDKEEFARTARKVQTHMTSITPLVSSETTSKFQESNFLKLMSMISNGKVEVSKEGDKFVTTATGEDIRACFSDSLQDEEEGALHFVYPRQRSGVVTNESFNVRGHLPDPLAHIKDGELLCDLSSLQAARVISGGQVERNDWMEDDSWSFGEARPRRGGLLNGENQELYDDYRNEDDFF